MKFKAGDKVSVSLADRSVKMIKIVELHPNGITGKNVNLLNPKLTFYPFHNILSVSELTSD